MYLANLTVRNFRCLGSLSLDFQPGLNVILGENNTGKSALIDALRMIFSLGPGRRDIYADENDLHHDRDGRSTGTGFELHATFRGLSPDEKGAFSLCLTPTLGNDVAQLHIRYQGPDGGSTRKPSFTSWGGEHEGDAVPSGLLEGMRAVYLEPLRNAEVGLQPGRGSRISKLLQLLVGNNEQDKERLVGVVQKANRKVEKDELVRRAKTAINTRLAGVTGPYLAQTADLRLTTPQFRRIAESLRALAGSAIPMELDENGLGYNNLLFIATVLSELQEEKAREDIDLAVLLIEEPEAHLHPHLQTVLVDYLASVTSGHDPKSQGGAAGEEAGEKGPPRIPIQVFVTSHSPTLASRVDLSSISVLYLASADQMAFCPLSRCSLTADEKAFLRRFLDVTKAQLFFARGVIFVEGISEALLLPEFARILETPLGERGVSIVNVESLAFGPFAKLFRSGAIDIPAVLLSDGDPQEERMPDGAGEREISRTAQALRKLQGGKLKVKLARKTFEYDLALAGNAEVMAEAYQKVRPKKGQEMIAAVASATDDLGKAKAFWQHFGLKDKARLAQVLAACFGAGDAEVKVPPYIKQAIAHVCRKKPTRSKRTSKATP